jgi:hypothetical protein
VYIRQRFARRRYKGSAHTTPTHLNPPRADVDGDDAPKPKRGVGAPSAARFWLCCLGPGVVVSRPKFQNNRIAPARRSWAAPHGRGRGLRQQHAVNAVRRL